MAKHINGEDQIRGVWQFTHSILMDSEYNILPADPVNNAKGIIIYENGYVSVQLTIPKHEEENSSIIIDSAHVAYYGRYTIEQSNQTVNHHVEGSSLANMLNSTFQRKYKFHSDEILSLINIDSEALATGQKIYRELFWQRVN